MESEFPRTPIREGSCQEIGNAGVDGRVVDREREPVSEDLLVFRSIEVEEFYIFPLPAWVHRMKTHDSGCHHGVEGDAVVLDYRIIEDRATFRSVQPIPSLPSVQFVGVPLIEPGQHPHLLDAVTGVTHNTAVTDIADSRRHGLRYDIALIVHRIVVEVHRLDEEMIIGGQQELLQVGTPEDVLNLTEHVLIRRPLRTVTEMQVMHGSCVDEVRQFVADDDDALQTYPILSYRPERVTQLVIIPFGSGA